MSKTSLQIPPEIDDTGTEERIAFVTKLWDQILRSEEDVRVPDHHKAIIEERLREYRANPQSGKLWSEVCDELLARYSSR